MSSSLVDPDLLKILACPSEHHAPLRVLEVGAPGAPAEGGLQCTECSLIFPIRDGVPVLLLDDAITPS